MNRRAAVLVLVCAVVVAGCSRARRAERAARRNEPSEVKLRPAESRVDAVIGTFLAMPVILEGPAPAKDAVAARVDDGRRVEAKLYWVSVAPDMEPRGWMPPAGVWTATPASAGSRPSANGGWVLMVEIPIDAAGQGLTVGGSRIPLNWLPDPSLIRPETAEGPWRRPLGELLPPSLEQAAGVDADSPVRRWRYRLLTRGLEPEQGGPAIVPTPGRVARHVDPVLEAVARQTEAKWQIALATLWAADAEVARRVKLRLCAAVDFGNGTVMPAWGTESTDLESLLADLLSRRFEPAQKAERANAWLEAQPPAAVWTHDDAGVRDGPTGRAITTFGAANLLDRATLAWAMQPGANDAPNLVTLPPSAAGRVAAGIRPADAGRARAGGVPVNIHAGKWRTERTAVADPLPVTPPGLRIDALVGDWSMPAWLAGAPEQPMFAQTGWAGAALIQRRDSADGPAWWVYLECRSPGMTQKDGEATEAVRLWLGPTGQPWSVIRVSSTGTVVDELSPDQGLEGDFRHASVTREAGRWTAQVPIPARCIEADGLIRIAIVRMDASGRRWSWPRPMLPWQTEPGRVALDTAAWTGRE